VNANPTHRGLKLVEVVALVVIIAISIVLLIPIINSHRETQRRASCLNNMHQIGFTFQNYASVFNGAFPPSAQLIIKPSNGNPRSVGGFSFLVKLLSFMEYESCHSCLPIDSDPEDTSNPTTATAARVAEMMKTQMSEFACPSAPHGSAERQSVGITNYKALGATTRGSLAMAANPQADPPYGTATIHPDGAIFPSAHNLPAFGIRDGLSNTIFTIETIDEAASRWTVGKEVTLVGLPQASSPRGTTPQASYDYFAPPGYDGKWGQDSAVAKAGLRTFLAYDFSPKGADVGKYEDPGFAKTPPAYGPSSMHPGVVVCGMGDGSAQALSKQVDAANLFFLITKNNADPFYLP
jgi:type II secretory pathway pseudopilin PulG